MKGFGPVPRFERLHAQQFKHADAQAAHSVVILHHQNSILFRHFAM
jgi:hypothetical protein